MRGPDHDGGTEELQEDDGGANPKPAASTPSSKEWIKDQQTWREWHAEDLPTKISGMFPTRNACKCDVSGLVAGDPSWKLITNAGRGHPWRNQFRESTSQFHL